MSEWRVLGYVIEEKIKKGKFHIVHVTFPLGLGYMAHRDQSLFGEKKSEFITRFYCVPQHEFSPMKLSTRLISMASGSRLLFVNQVCRSTPMPDEPWMTPSSRSQTDYWTCLGSRPTPTSGYFLWTQLSHINLGSKTTFVDLGSIDPMYMPVPVDSGSRFDPEQGWFLSTQLR